MLRCRLLDKHEQVGEHVYSNKYRNSMYIFYICIYIPTISPIWIVYDISSCLSDCIIQTNIINTKVILSVCMSITSSHYNCWTEFDVLDWNSSNSVQRFSFFIPEIALYGSFFLWEINHEQRQSRGQKLVQAIWNTNTVWITVAETWISIVSGAVVLSCLLTSACM